MVHNKTFTLLCMLFFAVFLPMSQKKKIYTLPATGSVDFMSEATDEQKALLQSALDRLRDQINQKRILVKPCFQDFDRSTNTHTHC